MKLCLKSLSSITILLVFLLTSACLPASQQELETGRSLNRAFFDGDLDSLYKKFSPTMKNALDFKTFKEFQKNITDFAGKETSIKQENITYFLSNISYERISEYEKTKTPMYFLWSFEKTGILTGLNFGEYVAEPESQFSDYVTRTRLRLPFHGEWFVYWGGRTERQNYHVVYPSQRFAYDFVMAKSNKTFSGDGKKNEDYYCFGKEIIAPAAGKVLKTLDGIEDNSPGVMNPKQPFGNFIILDHQNGEFSVFCHFKKNSIAVKEGQNVFAGEVLGLCGNSGNSTEAHLHYHLQNSEDPVKTFSLPAKFIDYQENGQIINLGEPVRGVFIQGR